MSKSPKTIVRCELCDIITTDNPRNPAHGLNVGMAEEGIESSYVDLVQKLALSENEEDRKEFVRLIEQYESDSKGIVELANSRRIDGELQPITVRSFRSHIAGTSDPKQYQERYGIIGGERRFLAAAYNYAKHGTKPEIGATVVRANKEAAFDLAVAENLQRKDMTEVEVGLIFRRYFDQGLSIKDIAKRFSQDYQYVRGRLALSYLSEKEQQAVTTGKIGLTKAIQKGSEIRGDKVETGEKEIEPKKTKRRKTKTLQEVQERFDATPRQNLQALEELAWVMGVELAQAIQESNQRQPQETPKAA